MKISRSSSNSSTITEGARADEAVYPVPVPVKEEEGVLLGTADDPAWEGGRLFCTVGGRCAAHQHVHSRRSRFRLSLVRWPGNAEPGSPHPLSWKTWGLFSLASWTSRSGSLRNWMVSQRISACEPGRVWVKHSRLNKNFGERPRSSVEFCEKEKRMSRLIHGEITT